MKALRSIVRLVVVALPVIVTATSCEHKDIECPGATQDVHILFEWDKAADADVAGMTLFFYPQDAHGRIWRFDIAGRDGGHVELPPGMYSLTACNNDLPGITLEDTYSPSAIRATASRKVADGIYSGTGMLYGVTVSRLEVTPCGVRYVTGDGTVKECGRGLVRCRPDSMATEYTVRLGHVSGIGHIRSATAVLEGVRASMLLESARATGTSAALAMNMAVDRERSMLSGRGCAFAPPEPGAASYRLLLSVVRTDGKTVACRVEIKRGNLNFISRHRVIITADGVAVPDDGPGSGDIGGIDAAVDGWDVVETDVEPAI